MTLKAYMTEQVVSIDTEETVAVAARMLARNNIGCIPVCSRDGKLKGVVTDRDLVIRCLASGRNPEETKVRQIMTGSVVTARPDMEAEEAARLMGQMQIRRLPVVEQGHLRGMVSLGDLATRTETRQEATGALAEISRGVSVRE